MCLILFAWQHHPDYPLVVAANRDEFHARPTAPAHWWQGDSLFAGQDLEAGGTWLGISRTGRMAALTNYRDFYHRKEGDRSRGLLVVDALHSIDSPKYFLEQNAESASYEPFNLLMMVEDNLTCYESRKQKMVSVEAGVHGLSNAALNTPWPKVEAGRSALHVALSEPMVEPESLFALLADRGQSPDQQLPDTGIGLEWERQFSSMFIVGEEYGTRSSTVLLFHRSGQIDFYERTFAPDNLSGETIHFSLPALKG